MYTCAKWHVGVPASRTTSQLAKGHAERLTDRNGCDYYRDTIRRPEDGKNESITQPCIQIHVVENLKNAITSIESIFGNIFSKQSSHSDTKLVIRFLKVLSSIRTR